MHGRSAMIGEDGTAEPALARYRAIRAHTEALAGALSAEDQCVQSMPDASPVKWHRAHTTWFFETVRAAPRSRPATSVFDPDFGYPVQFLLRDRSGRAIRARRAG